MAPKWETAIIIWIGILLYFGIGSFHPRDADLFLIIFYSVLLPAATIYTVVIWVRDRTRREPEKSYHLSAYPQGFLCFAFDEGKRKQERRVERQREQQQKSDADHS